MWKEWTVKLLGCTYCVELRVVAPLSLVVYEARVRKGDWFPPVRRSRRTRVAELKRVIAQWDIGHEICWKCGKSIARAAKKYWDAGVCKDHRYDSYGWPSAPAITMKVERRKWTKRGAVTIALHHPE